jgi:RNase H-fold protein (predicted Holliday junction resolvase)
MQNTDSQSKLVRGIELTPKQNKLKMLIKTEDEKVSTVRAKQKSNEFEIASIICRQANKRQKERGVDVPAAKAGLIIWGQLRKNVTHLGFEES